MRILIVDDHVPETTPLREYLAQHQYAVADIAGNAKGSISKDFFIKNGDYLVLVSLCDVDHIEVGGRYARFYSSKGTFIVEQSLEYLEEHLPGDMFIRVHRNYVVNINSIDRIHLAAYTIQLKDKKHIPISRRYKDMLVKKVTVLK